MHYNLNGETHSGRQLTLDIQNRGLNYGDGIFETLRFAHNRINFWEDHYFRLMSSMRIVRMEIPMSFSPEFLEGEIRKTLAANQLEDKAARVKLLITRKEGGLYTPQTNDIDYLITVSELESPSYQLNEGGLNIDLFKDFYKPEGLLSNLKSTSSQFYTIASVFRTENKLDECILMNPKKEVVEAISANLFLLRDNVLKTAPLSSGCLKGIMRKQVLTLAKQIEVDVNEEAFSPFELQKADEVFLTNSIQGIRWVKRYRKKQFGNDFAQKLVQKLNIAVALN